MRNISEQSSLLIIESRTYVSLEFNKKYFWYLDLLFEANDLMDNTQTSEK